MCVYVCVCVCVCVLACLKEGKVGAKTRNVVAAAATAETGHYASTKADGGASKKRQSKQPSNKHPSRPKKEQGDE